MRSNASQKGTDYFNADMLHSDVRCAIFYSLTKLPAVEFVSECHTHVTFICSAYKIFIMWKAPGCLCFYSCPQIGAMAAVPWNFGSQTTAAVFTNEFIHQDRRYKPCQPPCVCVLSIHLLWLMCACWMCVFVRYSLPDSDRGQQTNTKPTEAGPHRARQEALGQKGRGAVLGYVGGS